MRAVKINVMFYESSNTSHCGKSQTFTLEQLGLQDCESSDDFDILLQDALLRWWRKIVILNLLLLTNKELIK